MIRYVKHKVTNWVILRHDQENPAGMFLGQFDDEAQADIFLKALRALQPIDYARVVWRVSDVMEHADRMCIKITPEWAEEFLSNNASNIQGLMVERGHAAIEDLLGTAFDAAVESKKTEVL